MPRPTRIEAQLRSRIDALAADLAGLVRREAMQAVQLAFGDGAAARLVSPSASRAPRRRGRRARGSRTADVAELAPRVLAQLQRADGQGVSEIASALSVDVERVKPVVAALLAEKRIRKTGQKRGTKYHAGGGRGASAAPAAPARARGKKKASRKRARRGAREKAAARRRAPRKSRSR